MATLMKTGSVKNVFAHHYSLWLEMCKLDIWLIRNAACVGERKRQRMEKKTVNKIVWAVCLCPSMRSLRNTVITL